MAYKIYLILALFAILAMPFGEAKDQCEKTIGKTYLGGTFLLGAINGISQNKNLFQIVNTAETMYQMNVMSHGGIPKAFWKTVFLSKFLDNLKFFSQNAKFSLILTI